MSSMRSFPFYVLSGLIPVIATILSPPASSRAWALELKGYADVTYSQASSGSDPVMDNGAFGLGEIDFFLTHVIRNRIEVLAEMAFESDLNGSTFFDLERVQVSYIFNDALKLHAGRFHTNLGYWNTAFHHGFLFQTSMDRPSFLDFEHNGGILPVHQVGLWASGSARTPPMKLEYGLMVGNGSHIEKNEHGRFVLKPSNISDPNENKSITANLTVRPSFLPGFALGTSGQFSEVQGFGGGSFLTTSKTLEVNQAIIGGHLVYENTRRGFGHTEVLSEFFRIRNEDDLTNTGRFTSTVYYVQMGVHLSARWIPYFRYERNQIKEEDPYFILLGSIGSSRSLFGLRFSQNPDSAFKTEVHVINPSNQDHYYLYGGQWAFGF